MKRILVTGGAGFIGRHTVALLESEGYDVIALDWDPMRMRDLQCLHKITGDMKDRPLVQALMHEYKPEGIIHLGAQSSVPISMGHWDLDAEQNIMGTISILDVAKKTGVKKIIYASSGGTVYGNPAKLPIKEDTSLNPQSPYGISKLAGEFYVRISGISHAILRYPNVYGPGQPSEGESGVVAIFIGKMIKDERCIIYGDGHQERDYVFVEDIARANIMGLESSHDGIFNIGAGEPITVNAIHRLISSAMGKSIWPNNEDARRGDIKSAYLDASKAKKRMGWQPMIGIEEGIKRTIEHMARGGPMDKSSASCAEGAGSIPVPASKNDPGGV